MANTKNITFETAVQEWLASVQPKVKVTTYAQYNARLDKFILPYFGKKKVKDVTPEMLDDFVKELGSKGFNEKYICDIVVQLKMVTKYISRSYGCPDPALAAELPKFQRKPAGGTAVYDEMYCRRLYKALTTAPNLTRTGILLTLFAGLKIGELCALKWSDIDLENGVITISKTLQRISTGENLGLFLTDVKPDSARTIPIAPFLKDILAYFITDDDCFLLSGKDTPVEARTMQYRLQSILKKEDLPGISFNELRKLFINRCMSKGIDVSTLADILGTTGAYLYCSKSTMDSKIEAINLLAEDVG